MLKGILAGLTTCALWGLTFVAPRTVNPFSPWDLTIARYGIFGFASALLMIHPRFRPTNFSSRRLIIGLLLGGGGYVGYFLSVAYAVRLAGAAIPPLIIGSMPVLLAVIANLRDKTIRWRSLAAPLGLVAGGVLIVNVATIGEAPSEEVREILVGGACAGLALAIWIAYGLVNAAVMRASDSPDALRWTCIQGIGAAGGSALILPQTTFATFVAATPAETFRFVAWALLMGFAGSWLATWCWAIASRRLPLALSAQLIVSETLFGLAYGFLFERRWPTLAEWIGCAFQIAGVVLAIAIFSRPDRRRMPRS
jgi:drug/metabolite transporter (DMT)-like permease